MSQIISQLSKCALPEARDDCYFVEELDYLVESIRRWARLFSQDQPPLTSENLKTIRIPPRVREYFISAFGDAKLVINAKNVGRMRTRLVEIIILRTLMGDRLWKRHIGFQESDYESHTNLLQKMNCTEEGSRAWSAFTIHHLMKDNPDFLIEKEKDISIITDMLLQDLSPFGGSARATREKLRDIVTDVAELGLEIARLPFQIRPIDLKPGDLFVADMMKEVDPEEAERVLRKTTIILSYPWVKVKYNEMGKSSYPGTPLIKARVSCVC